MRLRSLFSSRIWLSFGILLALLLAPAPHTRAETPAPPPAAGAYRPGAVLVKFKAGSTPRGRAALAVEGLKVTGEIPTLGVLEVATQVGEEEATVEALSRRSDVAYAEPDYWARTQLSPNDPSYVDGQQWGLQQVRAAQAWDMTTGSSNVVIALVDSGIDLNHPDLAGKLWRNPGETRNGRDDDGNGCIDDINGCRYLVTAGASGDGQVKDDNGHGTHVAGIAGAATNNAIGGAGVSWASPLMAVKTIDQFGLSAYSDIAKGILYAAANGAAIINLSVGGAPASQTVCDAVSTAVGQGKLVVAAAGNRDQGETVLYPAMCPGALAVAATDRADAAAPFSIAGPRVDLAAPGVDILSTWYYSGTGQSGYRSVEGTSQAAPFVSGAAALVWARWPGLTAEGVKAQLTGTAVDAGPPGKDDGTGWGRLDVGAAVGAAVQPVDLRLSVAVAPQTVVAGNPMTVTFGLVNAGPAAATSVTLNAMLPGQPAIEAIQFSVPGCRLAATQMTCGVSRLDAGASVAISVVMTPTAVGDGDLTTTGTVGAAQPELTPADNGQTVTSTIRPVLSGRVFVDGNGDGIRQPWETRGVAGAGLFLYQDGLPVGYRASQGTDGAYQFDTLALGSYVLTVDPLPAGFLLTTPEQIALVIEPARETVVYFGAWTGVAEPTPTMTPTPTVTPDPRRSLYLPVIMR